MSYDPSTATTGLEATQHLATALLGGILALAGYIVGVVTATRQRHDRGYQAGWSDAMRRRFPPPSSPREAE